MEQNAPREETVQNEQRKPIEEPALLFCHVCDSKLHQHRCKLVCDRCGYFMSCADYY